MCIKSMKRVSCDTVMGNGIDDNFSFRKLNHIRRLNSKIQHP